MKPGQSEQELMGNQIVEGSGMKAHWKKKKLPRDLIKFGVREHEQGKKYRTVILPLDYLTLMFNAASSPRHNFIGTNLRQMISAALGLLELLLNSSSPGSTQSNTVCLWHRELFSKNLKCCSQETWYGEVTNEEMWVLLPALLQTSCVILGKSPGFSEPLLSCPQN